MLMLSHPQGALNGWKPPRIGNRRRSSLTSSRGAAQSCPTAPACSGAPGGECLWVAKLGDRVVGRIRLVQVGGQVAELCQLRLNPEWQHTAIPHKLVCCLQDYCRERGCSKLVAEDRNVPGWFRALLHRKGFRLSQEQTTAGRTLYEFCSDLCREGPPQGRACGGR